MPQQRPQLASVPTVSKQAAKPAIRPLGVAYRLHTENPTLHLFRTLCASHGPFFGQPDDPRKKPAWLSSFVRYRLGAVGRIQRETGVDFYLHPDDGFLLDRLQESAKAYGLGPFETPRVTHHPQPGDRFTLGDIAFTAVHMPGHSPGSLGYLFPDRLIGGDVLFAGSIGRTDLPGADHETLMETLKTKILTLDDAVVVHPGHGPSTSIRQERAANPFLLALERQSE